MTVQELYDLTVKAFPLPPRRGSVMQFTPQSIRLAHSEVARSSQLKLDAARR